MTSTPGSSTLVVKVRRGDGMSSTVALAVDGRPAGTADLPLFMRMMSSVGPSLAHDHGSPVSGHDEAPFPFAGTLREGVIQLLSRHAVEAQRTTARSEMSQR